MYRGIVKDQVNHTNKNQFKKAIVKAWKEIDKDKDLYRSLISSIPRRLKAVIKKGEPVRKEDDYMEN